jgi:hypothetical protein
VLENADNRDLRISVFTGPVFAAEDEQYRGVQLPRQFWKLVCALASCGPGPPSRGPRAPREEVPCRTLPTTRRPSCRRPTPPHSSIAPSSNGRCGTSIAASRAIPRHRATSRPAASSLRVGYPEALLASVPAAALASFADVGYHLDLADFRPGDRVLDLGSCSGTDAFCAAAGVGDTGRVVGVDFTDAQVAKARSLGEQDGIRNVQFVEASIDDLPFADVSFDAVISNGVINLSPVKDRVFAEAARVLRQCLGLTGE